MTMSSATTLNNIVACRLHKHNARDEIDSAERTIRYCRDKLLVLAASTPRDIDEGSGPVAWHDYVVHEVDSLLETIQDDTVRCFMARHIVENPDDCEDELEEDRKARGTVFGDWGELPAEHALPPRGTADPAWPCRFPEPYVGDVVPDPCVITCETTTPAL
jgi:hypothetical protein